MTQPFIAHFAFLLLFPGFFFYQTLLAIGVINAFLGGYFAVVSIVLTPFLISSYFYRLKHGNSYFSKIDLLFILFIAYFICIILFNYFAGANTAIVISHATSTMYLINLFIIFREINFSYKIYWLIAIFNLAAMSAIVFYFAVDGSFYLAALEESKNPESVSSYQGFSRSYLVTFIVAICFAKRLWLRLPMYVVGVATLYLNGARSEFISMLFLCAVVELYYSRKKPYFILLTTGLITLFLLNIQTIRDALPNNRTIELFDLSQSSSAALRHTLSEQAIQTIYNSPIFGSYASYDIGSYAHNILSAWVDLGLLGLFLFLSVMLWPAWSLLTDGYFSKTRSGSCVLASSLMAITLLMLFTSHGFVDMVAGAALGAYVNYRLGKIQNE